MRTTRLFYPHPLKCGEAVTLTGTASHYLHHVLRLKLGTTIHLFNGHGGQFKAHIAAIHKQSITVSIEHFKPIEVESPLNLTLGQAIAKSDRMDLVIQKATELGVTTLVPLITQYCTTNRNPQHLTKRYQHWQRVIESACEQCGRNHLPTLLPPTPFSDWVKQSPHPPLCLLLDPLASQPLSKIVHPAPQSITLLVGPEGGWHPQEIELAKATQFTTVTCTPRILRTETAAVAALVAMQTLYGDL